MRKITILGATGLIGNALKHDLLHGYDLFCPAREEDFQGENLGVVICCVGMTANFRTHLNETFDAHLNYIKKVLVRNSYDKCIYLSSSRVYKTTTSNIATEDTPIAVYSHDPSDVYTISKLAGESFVLQHNIKNVVLRISNVVAHKRKMKNFIGQVIRDIETTQQIIMHSTLNSCKDYITLAFLVNAIKVFFNEDTAGIYNVSSGVNMTHQTLLDYCASYYTFSTAVHEHAITDIQPIISNAKLLNVKPLAIPSVQQTLEVLQLQNEDQSIIC